MTASSSGRHAGTRITTTALHHYQGRNCVTIVVIVATSTGRGRAAAIAGWNHALLISAGAGVLTAVLLLALHRQGAR